MDVSWVVELVPKVELRSVPHAPASLVGLLNYRGKVVPVIDIGLLLAVDACRDLLSTRIILVDDAPGAHNRGSQVHDSAPGDHESSRSTQMIDRNLLGLVAEQVNDLFHANPDQVGPAPVQLPEAPYLDAIVQTSQGIVQLIAVDKIRNASLCSLRFGPQTVTGSELDHEISEHGFQDSGSGI